VYLDKYQAIKKEVASFFPPENCVMEEQENQLPETAPG
jgi:hypothetical protein